MSNVLIEESTLQNIANSIRAKNGSTDTYKPSEMSGAISNIQTGDGGDAIRQLLSKTITEFSDDTLTTIGNYGFHSCNKLESIYIPSVTSIGLYAFMNCSALTSIDLSSGFKKINTNTFANCSALNTIILRSTTVVSLANQGAVGVTGIGKGTGYLYVPDDLVESYKVATNWSVFADQIKPISELGE